MTHKELPRPTTARTVLSAGFYVSSGLPALLILFCRYLIRNHQFSSLLGIWKPSSGALPSAQWQWSSSQCRPGSRNQRWNTELGLLRSLQRGTTFFSFYLVALSPLSTLRAAFQCGSGSGDAVRVPGQRCFCLSLTRMVC